jgi:nitroreductase
MTRIEGRSTGVDEQSAAGVPISDLIALATRAPSVHNSQPWHWCLDGDGVVLFADGSRQLDNADPNGRDLVLSCGAALQHLQVASAAAGWKAQVKRMPNPFNDSQLANVRFTRQEPTGQMLTALGALKQRRTDRRRPAARPVPREQLDSLLALGPANGVTIVAVVSRRARTELLELVAEAEKAQRLNPAYVDEIVRWSGQDDDEGIPASSLLRRETATGGAEVAATRFPSGTLTDHAHEPEPVQPALLAICTSSDDTASRLRAGEALGAVLVNGTAAGLAMVPLSQAIEVGQTRRLLQNELLADVASPQILVQVGWPPATATPIPATPRRPVNEVLGDVGSLPAWMGPYQP